MSPRVRAWWLYRTTLAGEVLVVLVLQVLVVLVVL
jgi:hypothetical protein